MRDISLARPRNATYGSDGIHYGLSSGPVDINDHDASADGREELRGASPYAAAGASDNCDPAGQTKLIKRRMR
jgi:hypothetical protein